jgi:hypothetical protein
MVENVFKENTLIACKPSNSGDALKLMIPSYSRKAISGQNNYLGMVTSHKMNENEMGYRGSKSELNISSVKEQRVDGGYLGSIISPKLRCTLMGCENNYQAKVLSKQFVINSPRVVKFYSTTAEAAHCKNLLALDSSATIPSPNLLIDQHSAAQLINENLNSSILPVAFGKSQNKLNPWFVTGFTSVR